MQDSWDGHFFDFPDGALHQLASFLNIKCEQVDESNRHSVIDNISKTLQPNHSHQEIKKTKLEDSPPETQTHPELQTSNDQPNDLPNSPKPNHCTNLNSKTQQSKHNMEPTTPNQITAEHSVPMFPQIRKLIFQLISQNEILPLQTMLQNGLNLQFLETPSDGIVGHYYRLNGKHPKLLQLLLENTVYTVPISRGEVESACQNSDKEHLEILYRYSSKHFENAYSLTTHAIITNNASTCEFLLKLIPSFEAVFWLESLLRSRVAPQVSEKNTKKIVQLLTFYPILIPHDRVQDITFSFPFPLPFCALVSERKRDIFKLLMLMRKDPNGVFYQFPVDLVKILFFLTVPRYLRFSMA